MIKKSSWLVSLSLVVSLFSVLSLIPFAQAEQLFPVMPAIGSVTVTGSSGWQTNGTISNLDKMGSKDWVYFEIKDASGKAYPNQFYFLKDGKPEFLEMQIAFDVKAGDGKVISDMRYVLADLMKARYGMTAGDVRATKICIDSSTGCSKDTADFFKNPLIPGVVTLSNIKIELLESGTGRVVDFKTSGPNLKLFTISNPPKLNSVDKSSIKFGETVTLKGENFDVFGSNLDSIKTNGIDPAFYLNRGSNKLIIDFDKNKELDMVNGNFLRLINGELYKEDMVHYCDTDEIKFEMPADKMIPPKVAPIGLWKWAPMPLGSHTLTLVNDFGYSNTIDINVVGGTGEGKLDKDCANASGTITSISPTSGPVGTKVTINGSGFVTTANSKGDPSSWNLIKFNGTEAGAPVEYVSTVPSGQGKFANNGGTKIVVKVPAGATTGPITVLPGLGFTIGGPDFEVTPGIAPDDGSDPDDGTAFSVNNVFPDELNINSDNIIVIRGAGFMSPKLSTDNADVTLSDIEVNDEGTSVRAKVNVAQTAVGTVKITLIDSAGSGEVQAELKIKSADAPNVANVSISDIDADYQADVTISGQNLDDVTSFEVAGIQATVINFQSDGSDSLKAKLLFAENLTQGDLQRRWVLVREALASTTNPGAGKVCNASGCDSVAMNAPKPNSFDNSNFNSKTSTVGENRFRFAIDNPFKGDVDNVMDLLAVLANFIFQLGIPVAVIIIIYSGITFLTSADKPARVTKAINGLKYAAIGLAILLIGKGFVSLIQSILSIK
ncbi:MAG: IPT/TIG domain-containing protein [bacterium]|nr:IPT/TIG domain-containing protein [bacterium]